MLTAAVHLDLTTEPEPGESADRRTLAALDRVPDGVRVVLNVGSRRRPTLDVAVFLHPHVSRLHIEILGAPEIDHRAWLQAGLHGPGWLEAIA